MCSRDDDPTQHDVARTTVTAHSASPDPTYPYGEFDASKWADEFDRLFPGVMDKGTMLGWFANAIMTGFDKAKNEPTADASPDPSKLTADERIGLGWSRAEIVDRFAAIIRNGLGPDFWQAPPPDWAVTAAETIWQNVEAIVRDRLETDKADIKRLRAALQASPAPEEPTLLGGGYWQADDLPSAAEIELDRPAVEEAWLGNKTEVIGPSGRTWRFHTL